MLDVFNINDNSLTNQVFYHNGVNAWQVWHKPPNCNFINFYLLGGGAGGQGGFTGGTGTVRNGGTGGGSAAVAYITVPAFAIPNMLYVLVASGGTGGLPNGGAGSRGGLSYISTQPDNTLSPLNILMVNGSAAAGVTTSATAGAVITANNIVLAEIGFTSAYAGQTGGAGGAGSTAAVNITPNGLPTTAGAGGSGIAVSVLGRGGSIVGILDFPTISGSVGNLTGASLNGNDGYSTRENFVGPNFKHPMFFTGGAGGGATNTGTSSAGGNGSFGCGGGGGGAGATGITHLNSKGGNGGAGLVIITAS